MNRLDLCYLIDKFEHLKWKKQMLPHNKYQHEKRSVVNRFHTEHVSEHNFSQKQILTQQNINKHQIVPNGWYHSHTSISWGELFLFMSFWPILTVHSTGVEHFYFTLSLTSNRIEFSLQICIIFFNVLKYSFVWMFVFLFMIFLFRFKYSSIMLCVICVRVCVCLFMCTYLKNSSNFFSVSLS